MVEVPPSSKAVVVPIVLVVVGLAIEDRSRAVVVEELLPPNSKAVVKPIVVVVVGSVVGAM